MNKSLLLVVLSFALLALFSISQASLYSNALIRLAHQSEFLEEEFDDYLYELQSSTYTVVQGDTLGRIASRFGTTVRAIADLNGIQDVNKIRIGQVLRLPGSGGNPTPSPAPRPAPTPSPNPQPQPQPQPRPNPGRATGADIIAYARQFIGCRYVFGGNGPLDQICGSGSKGVDCSGFVQQVYKHFGYNLSRVVKTQKYDGIAVASINEARAGDLIMHTNEYEGHIGFFTGNGLEYLHASSPSAGIKITSKWNHPAAITIIRRIIY